MLFYPNIQQQPFNFQNIAQLNVNDILKQPQTLYNPNAIEDLTQGEIRPQQTCFNPFTLAPCKSPEELEQSQSGWFGGIGDAIGAALKSSVLMLIAFGLFILGVYLLTRQKV